MDLHVLPAYGRDYKTKSAVLADWLAGKDFIDSRTGRYLSIRDAKENRLTVWIRYNKGSRIIKT